MDTIGLSKTTLMFTSFSNYEESEKNIKWVITLVFIFVFMNWVGFRFFKSHSKKDFWGKLLKVWNKKIKKGMFAFSNFFDRRFVFLACVFRFTGINILQKHLFIAKFKWKRHHIVPHICLNS